MKSKILIAAALCSMTISAPVLAADLTYDDLIGSWTVVGVAVPDDGIQALVTDDPQYMGAVVAFAADNITWTKGTDARPIEPSIDNCGAAPTLQPWQPDPLLTDEDPVEGGFLVLCGVEDWGIVLPVDDQTVELHWLDNGVLKLSKQ